MKLASILAELLLEHNWEKIYVPLKYLGKKNNVLQRIAIDILLDKICICPGSGVGKILGKELNIYIIGLKGNYIADAVVIKKNQIPPTIIDQCICRKELIPLAPVTPIFIIDMGLWHLHYDDEKHELIEQLLVTLSVIRRYLWDRCLIITNSCPEFFSMFNEAAKDMKTYIKILNSDTKSVIKDLDLAKRAVVLDPYATKDLTDEEIKKFKAFIIGGILDKGNRMPGATTKLCYSEQLHELRIPRRRIALRGKVIGVPERINRIVEILLKNIIEGYSLERAIVSSMTKSDKVMRILHELQQLKINQVSKTYIANKFSWLDISENVIEEVMKRIK